MALKNDGTATGRRVFAVRVAASTPEKMAALALESGFYFIGPGGERKGAAGQLLDALASGKLAFGRPGSDPVDSADPSGSQPPAS